jgi:RimJ/RimL family protein N-acetyltransferase
MLDFNIKLQTDRILLRPIEREDIAQFEELAKDKSMWLYFTSDLSEEIELAAWVDSALKQIANKSRLAFSIVDKPDNKVIGSTSFGNISARDKRIEIGWTWLGKKHQGKGVNNQAKHLMLAYCFESLGFERVEFKTDVLNLPARKALVKIGMVEEGVLRSHTLMTHDRRRDTIFYSILKSEWRAVKAKNNWV